MNLMMNWKLALEKTAMKFLMTYLFLGFLFLADVCFLQGYGTSRDAEPCTPTYQVDKFNWSSFPPGFLFGASSSAYQVLILLRKMYCSDLIYL